MERFSKIEFFYSNDINENEIRLESDEYNHCINVFRNKLDDIIFITDGQGNIYKSQIVRIKNKSLTSRVLEVFHFENSTENIFICIPLLKNKDRFRFAVEKCVELGITRFYFFRSERTIPTKFDDKKVEKIMIEFLKQSIRTHLPLFSYFDSFSDLLKNIDSQAQIFLFDLESNKKFNRELIFNGKNNYFIFGPEGGLSEKELDSVEQDKIFNFSSARLRSETAIIKLVSIIT